MNITTNDFIILRYLNWKKMLLEHPDYKKVISGYINGAKAPILRTKKGSPIIKNYIEDEGNHFLEAAQVAINKQWPILSPAFSSKIELLSRGFVSAMTEAYDTLEKNEETCIRYLAGKRFQGTLLIPYLNSSVSYDIEYNEDGSAILEKRILQLSDSDCIALYCDNNLAFSTTTLHFADIKTGEKVDLQNKEMSYLDKTLFSIDNICNFLQNYFLFTKFANVTEKFVCNKGSRQAKTANPEKDYINETGLTIRQVDVSYFTTIIRTEGFPRKGFFRMQPYKNNGEWQHRLQWIDATYVKGYTRKAKKLMN